MLLHQPPIACVKWPKPHCNVAVGEGNNLGHSENFDYARICCHRIGFQLAQEIKGMNNSVAKLSLP